MRTSAGQKENFLITCQATKTTHSRGIHKIRSSEAQDIADKADFDLAQAMIMQISKINIPVKIGVSERNLPDFRESRTARIAHDPDDSVILLKNVFISGKQISAGRNQNRLSGNGGCFVLN